MLVWATNCWSDQRSSCSGRTNWPHCFLLTFNLDKITTSQIDERFREYTTRHVDLMPWSSDSLSFTGSEFERVAIIFGENTDWTSRETISVLYTALSRAKQKALLLCHEDEMRSLLSLSPVDQIFKKLRSSENLGELLFELENQNDLLEFFQFIIVSKNFSQFNALKAFIF